jgi:hypothetical protein
MTQISLVSVWIIPQHELTIVTVYYSLAFILNRSHCSKTNTSGRLSFSRDSPTLGFLQCQAWLTGI